MKSQKFRLQLVPLIVCNHSYRIIHHTYSTVQLPCHSRCRCEPGEQQPQIHGRRLDVVRKEFWASCSSCFVISCSSKSSCRMRQALCCGYSTVPSGRTSLLVGHVYVRNGLRQRKPEFHPNPVLEESNRPIHSVLANWVCSILSGTRHFRIVHTIFVKQYGYSFTNFALHEQASLGIRK